MIRSLRLQNYKCFENQFLEFKGLTFLSGLNGTGKSSVIQALLLLRQSFQQNLLQTTVLALNGDLVHIGTGKDALYEDAKENVIGFELTVEVEGVDKGIWRFNYEEEADVLDLISENSSISNQVHLYVSNLFTDDFRYLQAERIGPRRFFETSSFMVRQRKQLGPAGEYTAQFLDMFRDQNIYNEGLSHPDAVSPALINQVDAWLGEVSPGAHITLSPNVITDTISLQYYFVAGNRVKSADYRAANVGFGITYVLPILVAVLSSEPGALLLIENPEAHLHPHGQVKMGELLALAASCGVQVVIETHSDHILNGIRLAVHGKKLSPDDVQLHYFQRNPQNGQAQIISPRIDKNGRIDQWPDGFFDEWEKSLSTLLMPGDM